MCRAIQELQDEAVEEACKALREMQQEAVDIAVAENTVNSLLRTAKALMKNLSLSADQALSAMNASESECAILKPMLQL